jgi:hypothetical protein
MARFVAHMKLRVPVHGNFWQRPSLSAPAPPAQERKSHRVGKNCDPSSGHRDPQSNTGIRRTIWANPVQVTSLPSHVITCRALPTVSNGPNAGQVAPLRAVLQPAYAGLGSSFRAGAAMAKEVLAVEVLHRAHHSHTG